MPSPRWRQCINSPPPRCRIVDCVVKQMLRDKITEERVRLMTLEIRTMTRLHHPGIVRFIGVRLPLLPLLPQ